MNLKAAANASNAQAAPHSSLDQSVMRRIANRDEQAMLELLDQHGDMLARLIGRLTAWHVDGDDILQDVLIVVWKKAHLYDGKGSLAGWLKRIATNRCRNYFRTLNSIQRKIEGIAATLIGKTETTQSFIAYDQPDSTLQLALTQLPQDDRTALVLYYLEELPGEEVAKIMNLKSKTFHVRLHRARTRLKQLMEES